MSVPDVDRLYQLLPAVYRMRDFDRGEPLRALLQVINEQVNVVEADIQQLYDNWFIETCQEWVVPYIADLIGYRPVNDLGNAGSIGTAEGKRRNQILYPRRDAANTIRDRRRKGTLSLLEKLAGDAANWPARAVEFYPLLALYQSINWRHPERGRTVDLRAGDLLDRIDGPFDELAHTVNVGRINSARTPGRYNIPNVGLFLWRLKPYSMTQAPAYALDRTGNRFTFSVLGNDAPLITLPDAGPPSSQASSDLDVPAWITRRAFERRTGDYYGPHRSLCIWRDDLTTPIPRRNIVPADLTDWFYRPQGEQVAVDPELGRIAFPTRNVPRQGVWVTYHYGFSDDMGGGEYPRLLTSAVGYLPDDGAHAERPSDPPQGKRIYRVGRDHTLTTINEAIDRWWRHKPASAIIEITDSEAYVEAIEIFLTTGQHLELRAADGAWPTIRLLDWHTSRGDALRIGRAPLTEEEELAAAGRGDDWADCGQPPEDRPPRVVLDGLRISGRSIQIFDELYEVIIRHCTLVPGWQLRDNCDPEHAEEPSLELTDTTARLIIDRSILGTIRVIENEVETDPILITIRDSILDSTSPEYEALIGPDGRHAHAALTVQRSTILGPIATHAITLGEDTIFTGEVRVARRQIGCLRFCYVPPGSRTPRRYECQPDLVQTAVQQADLAGTITPAQRARDLRRELLRVRPQFTSVRYGTPEYCRLTDSCAPEIARGADDESAMGAFHDLFEPQREANLRTRVAEYTPADVDAGILFVT